MKPWFTLVLLWIVMWVILIAAAVIEITYPWNVLLLALLLWNFLTICRLEQRR